MRKEPDCSDSFPILSRENYNPETTHSTTNILSPTETLSVSLTYTSFTTPSIGVRISFSIFMATNTQSGAPALTSSPTLDIYLLDHARHLGLYDLTADRLGTSSRQA